MYLVGTFDTKAAELLHLAALIRGLGAPVTTVDVSTLHSDPRADIPADQVAAVHPGGAAAVFTGDRGSAISAMSQALPRWLSQRNDIGALIGIGGSGGVALIIPAMRALPVGLPKLMVSSMLRQDLGPAGDRTDIATMYSVTDVAGINRISRRIFANAAGMIVGAFHQAQRQADAEDSRPAIGLSMFGVTTSCVRAVSSQLEADYDCVVFHATGSGGMAMEKLVDSGLLSGLIDLTTTEVCDYLFGGVLACTADRFGAVERTRIPYVGSCGALDMINFGRPETVPAQHLGRRFYPHNTNVTLMRTTPVENAAIGRWIGERLNRCDGHVRFLLPQGGVSALDAPGREFHDPEADQALFDALTATVKQTDRRRLVRVPHHINDPEFAAVAVAHFRSIIQADGTPVPFATNV
ncbi:UPF0261 family protein [Pigmentiphaga aceris]|uniref:UPF0261 family protein n=1 Tax=Pigmentiphaga aceris TaxID=1940612 RepID=A0A5C0B4B6_9BURK|nr:UPF0261 family protein [Pigmentiphaga aceris]